MTVNISETKIVIVFIFKEGDNQNKYHGSSVETWIFTFFKLFKVIRKIVSSIKYLIVNCLLYQCKSGDLTIFK